MHTELNISCVLFIRVYVWVVVCMSYLHFSLGAGGHILSAVLVDMNTTVCN